MKVKAHCPFLGHTGYNAHTRGFFTALSEEIDLRVDNYTWCDDRHNYLTARQKGIISEITLTGPEGQESQHPPDWKKEIEDFQYDVDIVLHEHNHKHFWRDYKKPKIAYTVWETDRFDINFFKKLLEYDELWVPSQWQKKCAIEQGYPSHRVNVVPEAVEPDCMPNPTVTPDDSIFTFCLLGRWDHRKSITEILQCFVELFGNNPKVQLIASINNPCATDNLSTKERMEKMGWGDVNNIILKSFPDRKEYVKILQSSHVFLSCARSEGWNIPLIEAMACGTPSIYSDCSGQTEFAQGRGIPIRILGKELARAGTTAITSQFTSDMPGHFFSPDFEHLKKKMQYCMDNYNILKTRALEESVEIRSQYTWSNAALIASKHLESFASTHKVSPSSNKKKVCVILSADDNYLKYATSCIASIKKHSNYNVVLYGYDTDFQGGVPLPDVEIRRLRRWPLAKDGQDLGVMGSRISMCLDALAQRPHDLFIVIDCDMIAVRGLDAFFKQQFDRLENYPLHLTYKHDNLIHFNIQPDGSKIEKGHGDEAAAVFGIKERGCTPNHPVNFTIAHGIFVFDKKSKPFLTELLELSVEALGKEPSSFVDNLALESERIENALFWKYGFTKHLPLSWVSRDEDNDFLQLELKKYIDQGFDIVYTHKDRRSYDILPEQLLFLHGKSSMPTPTLSKLMIVAHPDDETIFGFTELSADNKWKVVCVAPDGRQEDFCKAMRFYGINNYEIWDFNSSLTADLLPVLLDKKIQNLIEEKTWDKIVTHNPVGEYGHRQHKNIFDVVKKHCDDFYVFCKTPNQLSAPQLERKREALNIYKSEDIIYQLEQLNGDWFICNDMSTNYIEYGSVEKYDASKDISPFINCDDKVRAPEKKELKEVFLITSYCDTEEKITALKGCLDNLKSFDLPICFHDAYGLNDPPQVDYYIRDTSNPMPDLYTRNLYTRKEICPNVIINSHSLDYGAAAMHQAKSGILYLESLGYELVHLLNYDVFVDYNFFTQTCQPASYDNSVVFYQWGDSRERGLNSGFYSMQTKACKETLSSMSIADYIAQVPPEGHFEDYLENTVSNSDIPNVKTIPFETYKNLIYDQMSTFCGPKKERDGTFDFLKVFEEGASDKARFWVGRKKTLGTPEGGPICVIFYDIKENFNATLIVNGQAFDTFVSVPDDEEYFLLESTISGNDVHSASVLIDGKVVLPENNDCVALNSIEFTDHN